MKLSHYAKELGLEYRTVWNWYKQGTLKGYQLPSGTIIIENPKVESNLQRVIIYCRVSDQASKDNLERQAERLTDYALAKGYSITKVTKEIGSGLNDNRKQLSKVLLSDNYDILLVEHADRLARFGLNYLEILLNKNGKQLEIANKVEIKKEELLQDLISIIYSFSARIYGLRRAKNKVDKITKELHNEIS